MSYWKKIFGERTKPAPVAPVRNLQSATPRKTVVVEENRRK
jgi:hypothetical protein